MARAAALANHACAGGQSNRVYIKTPRPHPEEASFRPSRRVWRGVSWGEGSPMVRDASRRGRLLMREPSGSRKPFTRLPCDGGCPGERPLKLPHPSLRAAGLGLACSILQRARSVSIRWWSRGFVRLIASDWRISVSSLGFNPLVVAGVRQTQDHSALRRWHVSIRWWSREFVRL